jgi:hypothetical protein
MHLIKFMVDWIALQPVESIKRVHKQPEKHQVADTERAQTNVQQHAFIGVLLMLRGGAYNGDRYVLPRSETLQHLGASRV